MRSVQPFEDTICLLTGRRVARMTRPGEVFVEIGMNLAEQRFPKRIPITSRLRTAFSGLSWFPRIWRVAERV